MGIKMCACTSSKKVFLMERFPALKLLYDANNLRNITLKYIFHIRFEQMSC